MEESDERSLPVCINGVNAEDRVPIGPREVPWVPWLVEAAAGVEVIMLVVKVVKIRWLLVSVL